MPHGEIPITEEALLAMDFKKITITKEESGNEKDYYYFSYRISNNGQLTLLSDPEDGNPLVVKLLEVPDYEFTTVEPLIVLLNIIEDNRVIEKI
jgi:hypothetical protein